MKKGFFNTGFPGINFIFALIILVVSANVCFNLYVLRKNQQRLSEMNDVINPYLEALSDFNLLVTESKMYSTNWVYLKNSFADKKNLQIIHKRKYRQLQTRLESFTHSAGTEDADSLHLVFAKMDSLILMQRKVMTMLIHYDDYDNRGKKSYCEFVIEDEVLPRAQVIMNMLGSIITKNRLKAQKMDREIVKDSLFMKSIMLVSSVGLLIFTLFALYYITRGIREPVLRMKHIVSRLARGEITYERLDARNNLIGEMVIAVNTLSDSFKQTSRFANEIEKGNLTVPYKKLSKDDMLGTALIGMRNSLKAYSDEMEQKVLERTAEVTEKSKQIETLYTRVKDSIDYAKRIQESILPSHEIIASGFPDSFIYYRPKDIVCGDFYWYGMHGRKAILAVVDCTGHGVPGALMTVIGNMLLNQIVNFADITSPSAILYELDRRLVQTMLQSGTMVSTDGMDISICCYDPDTRVLDYCSAKRPMFLIRNGELLEYKGNTSSIGISNELNKHFGEHHFQMNRGDILYMYTDGITDQFGGPETKKFLTRRFRELLLSVHHNTLSEQKKKINKTLVEWQEANRQTDDMLLVGIRF